MNNRKFYFGGALLIICLGVLFGMFNLKNHSLDDEKTSDTAAVDNLLGTDTVNNHEIAFEVVTDCDYSKLAMSIDELVNDSDVIVEIRVLDTNSFVSESGIIQTEIVPEVVDVLKGEYSGQLLYVNGGEMKYEDYVSDERIAKYISGHENPDEDEEYRGKYVRQCVDGQYIVQKGETYIIFASFRSDSGRYYSKYAYQGTYKVVDGIVENEALKEEPLKEDLYYTFGQQDLLSESKIQSIDSAGEDKTIEMDELEFKEIIKGIV